MKYLILALCFSNVIWAQLESEREEYEAEKARFQEQIASQRSFVESNEKQLADIQKRVQEKKDLLQSLENYERDFGQKRIETLAALDEKIKSFPFFQKLGTRFAYFKCMRDFLNNQGALSEDRCATYHSPKLNADEEEMVNSWKKSVNLSLKEAESQKENLPQDIQNAESLLTTVQANLKYSQAREQQLKDGIKSADIKIAELDILPANKNFLNCDEKTPEINLEEKTPFPGANFSGPFYEVPRDNQDGLGTCYANAAKNLLVGISEGKDVASFLDIALQYKQSDENVESSGLDAGNSCAALDALKMTGYCPQNFAPMETGDQNLAGEGLFKLDAYNYLAANVNLLKDFLRGLDSFEKSSIPDKEIVLSKAKEMINTLKANPSIIIPMPVVKEDMVSEWKLRETYNLHKAAIGIPLKDFLKEYQAVNRSFFSDYVKAVVEGKNADQIFELFSAKLKPFLLKYNVAVAFDEMKLEYKIRVDNELKDPKLQEKMKASVQFLKTFFNKNDLSDEKFLGYCSDSQDSLDFLNALKPLVQKLREEKLNVDELFDKEGKFKSSFELMQLTVAPSCLAKENRKSLPPFSCDDGYATINRIKNSQKPIEEKVKTLRSKVVLSLVQGYPLGNSFQYDTGGHINTIVGLRFNPRTKSCEYLIRESQIGASVWTDENTIYNKIQSLTEVRRKP